MYYCVGLDNKILVLNMIQSPQRRHREPIKKGGRRHAFKYGYCAVKQIFVQNIAFKDCEPTSPRDRRRTNKFKCGDAL
jgi:hypothetical protein